MQEVGFCGWAGMQVDQLSYLTILSKDSVTNVFTINLPSHSHCVEDDCSIMNVEQM